MTILGPLNLSADTPYHASQMYAKNISTYLLSLISDGKISLDMGDEVVAETLLCRDGEVVNPRVRVLLGLSELNPAAVQENTGTAGEEAK